MYLLIIGFLLLIIYGIHRCDLTSGMGSTGLDLSNSHAIRGICAVEIMLGHIGIATDSLWLYPSRKAGVLFVGVFFTLSGYGLMKSLAQKKDYLKHFLRKRIGSTLLPAYIVYLLGGGTIILL